MLKISNLSTYYYTDDKVIRAVDDVSLKVKDKEFFGLVGPSGCGKSTLGYSIMKLISEPGRIVKGSVLLDGTDIMALNSEELTKVRGTGISMVFQDPMTFLNPVLTIGEQISEALRYHLKMDKKSAKEKAIELLNLVKIDPPGKRYNDFPHELSGGMRQRAIIAIAVSCGSKHIIADEPTTALDVTTQRGVMDLLVEMKETQGLSVMLITHNLRLVKKYCSSCAVMKNGRLIFQGESEKVREVFD
ncbi:MAG: ABC transporter ATP-binding protein [Candidatus Saganbacteria bacterium]|nr:ABC transporter ATP-binding protein [Candidatus Saganbacteria bacterium]